MKTMKYFLYALVFTLGSLTLASCEGGGDDPADGGENMLPGEIPGLGNKAGDLTGKPFALPAGVALTGGITGAEYDLPSYWAEPPS
jgi:hypothetical protein